MLNSGDHGDGRVLITGAINTDLVGVVERAPEAGETVTGRSFDIFGGGKGANQAVAARRSGAVVALVGALGRDEFGDRRVAGLRADDIDITAVARREDAPSGVALIVVEDSGENRITYIPGATLTVTATELIEAIDRFAPDVYLQPNEVPIGAARAGLSRAGDIGAMRILNAAPDPERARPLLEHVDLLIVNQGEALALSDGQTAPGDELQEVAGDLATRFSVDVVITGGADGVFAYHGGGAVHLPAPKVDVVDTTGAGDTFCGAFAARLALGADFREALRWAVVAASLATTRAGAQPSIPDAFAIQDLLGRQ